MNLIAANGLNWFLDLADLPKVALIAAVLAACASIVTKLIDKSTKAVCIFVALLILLGFLGYSCLPDNAKRIQDRIQNGDSFRILLYKQIGNAAPHYGYAALYSSSTQTMSVTGLVAGSREIISHPYPCKDLAHNEVVLWGHPFHFDSQNRLWDKVLGRCGIIYFDSDVAPSSK